MTNSLQKTFKFSEPFLKVVYIKNIANFPIDGKTIVINADDMGIIIEGKPLKP